MTEELKAPLTPPEADLRDFAFTPMYRARLFGSAFHARATDAEWRAGVTLWLKSQDQVPAGSLPDDDVELCRLAELARDFKQWRKVKAGALRGWVKCSDGRLYHPVVAEITIEQWSGKIEQRKRTLKARIAALEKRLKDATTEPARQEIESTLQKLRQEQENMVSALSQGPVTEAVTASKRERQGQGQGERQGQGDLKKDGNGHAPAQPPAAPLAPVTAKDRLWRDGPPTLGRLADKPANDFRPVIGRWLKTSTAEQVLDAIAKAQVEKAIDPVPFVTACLNRGRKQAALDGFVPGEFD